MGKGNKNYIAGRNKEYKVKRDLEKQGYIVLRTAGSHGFADLIAVDRMRRKILFIQCKPKNFREKEKLELEELWGFMNDNFRCSFEII